MLLKGTGFVADFDKEINNFRSLKNTSTGDDYVKSRPSAPMFSMVGLKNGTKDRVDLLPGLPDILGDEKRLVIQYTAFSGYDIQVELVAEACEDRILISGKIINQDRNVDVVEILCPHISGIYLGDDFSDDSIIYPHHAGERTPNPIREYALEKTQDFWRAGSVRRGDVFAREINYCGLASMSWMYYYDRENGFYIGSHDPRFPVTGIIAECGAEQVPFMGFDFRKHHRIGYGESYPIGEYVLAISNQDWHYGAGLYRSYIGKYLDFDHTPEFLKNEYALNQCYNFKRSGVIENRFRDIPRMYEAGEKWGVRHMFIASWNRTGFDSFYPEYYPDMELGSAMEFRRGLESIREHGGFSTLYINARIFDVKSDFHRLVGEKMAIRNENGDMLYETYGPERFTVSCPSDALWRDYLLDTAEFTVKAYGADGIYLDQLASAEPFACYCKEHTHADIGDFNNGYLYVLKELWKRLTKDNPDAYIMTENCGDIYGSYTWGNLTWNETEYDEYFNVFKYTFPEFVQVNMVNPRASKKEEPERMNWFLKDMQRAILLGNILWMGITSRLTENTGRYHTYAKQALAFRKEIQPLIKDAKFLDHEFIVEMTEKCDATAWELPDGRNLFLCGNHSGAEQAGITIRMPEHAVRMEKFNMEWQQETILVDKETILAHEGTTVLDLGKSPLCCFILEHG